MTQALRRGIFALCCLIVSFGLGAEAGASGGATYAPPPRGSLTKPGPLTIQVEAVGFAGMTGMDARPLLPRTGGAIGLLLALGNERMTWLALGVDGIIVNPSVPDPSLFLYRGFGGNSVFVESGARFGLGGLGWNFLRKGRIDLSGGAGLAAAEDNGTTLVSIIPYLRLDARLLLPLDRDWAWSLGLPLELQKRATALTLLSGLSVSIGWTPSTRK